MPEQLVGTVTHFFKGPSVAIVRLSEGEVAVGDDLHFHGHTSDFTEKVGSMEVDHVKVERATVGQEVALQVVRRARPGDRVLKVTWRPTASTDGSAPRGTSRVTGCGRWASRWSAATASRGAGA